jgi:hypothetical protein
VDRHIFQACPVWICTQSNITSIIFTWVHQHRKNHVYVWWKNYTIGYYYVFSWLT